MTRKYTTIQLTIDSLVTNLKGKLRDAVKFVLSNAFFFLIGTTSYLCIQELSTHTEGFAGYCS